MFVTGDKVYIGIKSISITEHEFLTYTKDDSILYWNKHKTHVKKISLEYCYYDDEGEVKHE